MIKKLDKKPECTATGNCTYAQTIYNLTKAILKDKFDWFYDLYSESLISGKYDYVVLVTRRAYVLYEIFLLCMQGKGETEQVKTKVITSDAIYILGYGDEDSDAYKQAKFLILDDIIINGRTVLDVYRRMQNLGINDIKIASMEKYEDAKFLSEIENNLCPSIRVVSEKMWKRDSDLLTNLIISSNIGYTSFVSSFILNQYTNSDWEKLIELFQQKQIPLKEIQSEALTQNGIIAKACFFDSNAKTKLNFTIDDKVQICIRLYYRKKANSLTVIPYSFFNNVLVDDCVNFCNQMLSKTKFEISDELLSFINENQHKNEIYSLLYKYTINHVNHNAFELFVDELGLQLNDKDVHVKFPAEYYLKDENWITGLTTPMYEPINSQEIKISDDVYHYNYAYNLLLATVDKNHNATENLFSFLNSIKAFDDKNAKNKNSEHRCVGIRILDIYNIFSKCNIEPNHESILLMIIGLWDEGTAAYNYSNIKCNDGTEAICGFLKNGEQIYKKIYLKYSDVYSYFYRLYNKASIYKFHHIEQFANFMSERTKDPDFTTLFNEIKKESEEHYYADLGCVVPKQICHKWDNVYYQYLDEKIYI